MSQMPFTEEQVNFVENWFKNKKNRRHKQDDGEMYGLIENLKKDFFPLISDNQALMARQLEENHNKRKRAKGGKRRTYTVHENIALGKSNVLSSIFTRLKNKLVFIKEAGKNKFGRPRKEDEEVKTYLDSTTAIKKGFKELGKKTSSGFEISEQTLMDYVYGKIEGTDKEKYEKYQSAMEEYLIRRWNEVTRKRNGNLVYKPKDFDDRIQQQGDREGEEE